MEPTPRELDALKVLWAHPDGVTVRALCDELNAEADEELAYTTVLSLLQVMEQKGLVDHTRRGKAYVYRPLVERGKTLGRIAAGFLEKVFDGAVHEYLVHAIDGRRLSADELDKIEAMIAEKRAKRRGKNARKKARKKGGR